MNTSVRFCVAFGNFFLGAGILNIDRVEETHLAGYLTQLIVSPQDTWVTLCGHDVSFRKLAGAFLQQHPFFRAKTWYQIPFIQQFDFFTYLLQLSRTAHDVLSSLDLQPPSLLLLGYDGNSVGSSLQS